MTEKVYGDPVFQRYINYSMGMGSVVGGGVGFHNSINCKDNFHTQAGKIMVGNIAGGSIGVIGYFILPVLLPGLVLSSGYQIYKHFS